MSAPPIPYRLVRPAAAGWPAWEHAWDALADGDWHRGADLVNSAHAADLIFGEPRSLSLLLLAAHRAGLLDRETRLAAAYAHPLAARSAAVLRPGREPWYRRPAGAA